MTDNEFNLEFNKKILYYRENGVATVYIDEDANCDVKCGFVMPHEI